MASYPDEPLYTLGIDVGSTSSKCVMLRNGNEIVGKSLAGAGAGTSGPGRAVLEVLGRNGLRREEMSHILATGYGRNSIDYADSRMSELSCHACGAHRLFPDARTVIDIGGQDAKVLRVGNDGNLEDFVMNDKCAAGTGRFLDVMARVLEVDISDMARLSAQSNNRLEISSTCTVFAESEVISQLANNSDICDIIDGIHRSVAGRVAGLGKRVGIAPMVVMTGGVAQNAGVLRALEGALGAEISTSPLAQYAGALGAAIFAYRNISKTAAASAP